MGRGHCLVLLLLASLITGGCPAILLTDADRDLMHRAIEAAETVQATAPEKVPGTGLGAPLEDPLKQLVTRSEDAAKRAEAAARKSEAAAGRAENATAQAEQDANKALQEVLKFLRDLDQ